MTLPIIGVKDRWQLSPDHDLQTAVWLLAKPAKVAEGDSLIINLGSAPVASVRISITPFASGDPLQSGIGEPLRNALAQSARLRSKADRNLLNATHLFSTAWDEAAFAKVQSLWTDLRECRGGRAWTMITEAREPLTTRVLPRGNWQDDSGEIVEPATPHFLPPPPEAKNRRLTRLDLARWLVSRDNPLTARTLVNRLWKEFFGQGLAPVLADLGAQGEAPSHPDLLDWLEVEFMERGWGLKHIVKLVVTSATYSQTANRQLELTDLEPHNS